MHVLLIHQAFAGLDEAGGTRHIELARVLAKNGHRVTIIASSVSYLSGKRSLYQQARWIERETPEDGIMIIRAYTYAAQHRSFFHRLIGFISFMVSSFLAGLSVHNVDLVWGTSPPIFQGMTAWLLARLKRVPFLFEVRDLWPDFAIAVGVLKSPLLIAASHWLEKFLYRHADRVMVNSPGFIDHISQNGAKRIELVPNGSDPEMFDPDGNGNTFRAENGLDGKFLVTYAGAHGLSNDLGVVITAAQHLQNRENIHFVLVGDGKEKAALLEQAKALKLANICFYPPVPKTQMAEILAASDACIAILKPLELYKTTYPNKVFDYMAAGRPVLLAIDGVIRTVVETAGAGLFIQPGEPGALAEAVLFLEQNPTAARAMGTAGRTAVEKNFSRAVTARQFMQLLENMERDNA